MTCVHLRKLYQLCEDHGLKLASQDLIKIACKECGEMETCPSVLLDEYESMESQDQAHQTQSQESKPE